MRHEQQLHSVLEEELNDFLARRPLLPGARFSAHWLLNDSLEPEWILADDNGLSRKDKNGAWLDATTLRWNVLLPNGKRLTDDEYSDSLKECHAFIHDARSGPNATIFRTKQQYQLAQDTFTLLRWMVLNGFSEPATFLRFSSLTPRDFEEYCKQVIYGPAVLERFEERLLAIIEKHEATGETPPLDPSGHIDLFWLSKQSHIERRRLRRFLPVSPRLRQALGTNTNGAYALSKYHARREYVGNRNRPTGAEQLPLSETRVASLLDPWRLLSDDGDNKSYGLTFRPFTDIGAADKALDLGAIPKGRTRTLSPYIGLFYLDKALTWVQLYGRPLVEYISMLEERFQSIRGDGTSARNYYAPKAFAEVPIPTILSPLNISRLHDHPSSAPRRLIREQMSVVTAIKCLYASCYIVMAFLSLRRGTELRMLNTNCMLNEFDGIDLQFGLLKAFPVTPPELVSRPAPPTVKHCVELLLGMTACLRSRIDDPVLQSKLFLYGQYWNPGSIGCLSYVRLCSFLDLFTDVIEAPLLRTADGDTVQRRWYLRPHECRRFFALAFFWFQSAPNLSALTWFMGHLDPKETLRYIRESMSGEEFAYEASSYLAEALYSPEQRDDLAHLKHLTLNHFKVSSLDFIKPHQLTTYLATLCADGSLKIAIHPLPHSQLKFPIAIELRRNI